MRRSEGMRVGGSRRAFVVLAGLLAFSVLAAPLAGHAAVREGTILLGAPAPAGCEFTVTCAAWERSGCPAELQGDRGPAWIVNISGLQGSSRVFRLAFASPTGVQLHPGGGVNVLFFTSSCKRVAPSSFPFVIHPGESAGFTIPSSARVMTVSAGFVVNVRWTLT